MASGAATSPTVLRWELAARLRELRTQAGRSIEEAASELMCSPAKISRLETGGRGIQARDVRDLCRFYGVPDKVRDGLIVMANEAKRPGWWQDFRSLDEQTTTFLGLEAAASSTMIVESRGIPGPLQTEEYTRLMVSGVVVADATNIDTEEMVAVRQKRGERVRSGGIAVSVIIDEATAARNFGRPDVMAAQLDQVIDSIALPNVTIRVLPFSAPSTPAVEGSFQYLAFADHAVADLVYVEGLLGKFLVDRVADVERYVVAYEETLKHSLSDEASLAWLKKQRSALGHKPRTRSPRKTSSS
jgi:transcriptional regulator with XRE-family HTH domain